MKKFNEKLILGIKKDIGVFYSINNYSESSLYKQIKNLENEDNFKKALTFYYNVISGKLKNKKKVFVYYKEELSIKSYYTKKEYVEFKNLIFMDEDDMKSFLQKSFEASFLSFFTYFEDEIANYTDRKLSFLKRFFNKKTKNKIDFLLSNKDANIDVINRLPLKKIFISDLDSVYIPPNYEEIFNRKNDEIELFMINNKAEIVSEKARIHSVEVDRGALNVRFLRENESEPNTYKINKIKSAYKFLVHLYFTQSDAQKRQVRFASSKVKKMERELYQLEIKKEELKLEIKVMKKIAKVKKKK